MRSLNHPILKISSKNEVEIRVNSEPKQYNDTTATSASTTILPVTDIDEPHDGNDTLDITGEAGAAEEIIEGDEKTMLLSMVENSKHEVV
ncbi:hypothetical protein BGX27_003990, partial [Mortierella sp. AM989]